jgi:hypothetical protein
VGGLVHFEVNERPWATIDIDLPSRSRLAVDLSAELTLNQLLDTCERRVFTGSVKAVTHGQDRTTISAEMGQELVGLGSTLVAHRNCGLALVYSIAATFHVPYRNEGSPLPENETEFEVSRPVSGVSLTESARYSDVELKPMEIAILSLKETIDVPVDFEAWLREFPAMGSVTISTPRMHDAQEQGVRRIDEVLAKLATISRYSLLTGPHDEPWIWTREHKFFNPQRARVAIVVGRLAPRSWIQRLEVAPFDCTLDPNAPPLVKYQTDLPSVEPLSERQAMLFLTRAGHRISPIDRVIFMWQAVEFFLGDYKPPTLFDGPAKKVIKSARDFASQSLTPEQAARLRDFLGGLNSPSMRMKLEHYIESTGVPVSKSEYDLLWDLRSFRNDIIHGREPTLPAQETIDHGVAVVARLFLWPH